MKRSTRLQRPGLLGGSTATTLLDDDGPQPSLNLDLASGILDPRIDFQRTTVGTFYRGVFNQNLLLRSQEFDNTTIWGTTIGGTGVAPVRTANNAVAPDGTMTADTITFDAGNGTTVSDLSVILQVVTSLRLGLQYTLSFWIRASSGSPQIVFRRSGDSFYTLVTATSAWQRISVTDLASTLTTANVQIGIRQGQSGIGTINSTATVELWGAQLTEGSLLTPYIPTTTAAITQGQIASAAIDVPRFENDPVTGEASGLLIEGGATNVVTGTSAGAGLTLTTNAITSPSGVVDANLFQKSDTTTPRYARWETTITPATNTTYTASMFVKRGNVDMTTSLEYNDAANWGGTSWRVDFSVTSSGVTVGTTGGGATGTVQPIGNGWYRVTATFTTGATAPTSNGFILAKVSGTTGDNIYLWGGQLESQAFASSYIPTTTATVARGADSAVMTGTNFSSWYNQSEGTLLAQFVCPFNIGLQLIVEAGSSSTVRLGIVRGETAAAQSAFFVVDSTLQAYASLSNSSPVGTTTGAGAYRLNDFAYSASGISPATDTVGTVPSVNQLNIGASLQPGARANGNIRRIAYWPTRLPNATLQSLTT